jgi:hypothetical protein
MITPVIFQWKGTKLPIFLTNGRIPPVVLFSFGIPLYEHADKTYNTQGQNEHVASCSIKP